MKLLTTTAIAASLAAAGAFAESHMSDTDAERTDAQMTDTQMADGTAAMSGTRDWSTMTSQELGEMRGNLIRSRDITGGAVYTVNEADDEGWNGDTMYEEVDADWNQIGEIEDLVLSKDGQIIGIVAEVGGFLDIGDKHVMIAVNDLNLVATDDQTYTYVTRYSEEELEEMPSVDEGFWN